MMTSRFRKLLTRLPLLALFLAGCQNYAPLQTEEPLRIAVGPVVSQSGVPQVIAPLSRNLREHLNHAEGWTLVGEPDAEVVLHIEVLGLDRDAVARDPADTGRPLSYYETLKVALRWESELPPPWGSESTRIIEGDALIFAQPSLLSSESVALAEMAEAIARKIIDEISWPARPGHP